MKLIISLVWVLRVNTQSDYYSGIQEGAFLLLSIVSLLCPISTISGIIMLTQLISFNERTKQVYRHRDTRTEYFYLIPVLTQLYDW